MLRKLRVQVRAAPKRAGRRPHTHCTARQPFCPSERTQCGGFDARAPAASHCAIRIQTAKPFPNRANLGLIQFCFTHPRPLVESAHPLTSDVRTTSQFVTAVQLLKQIIVHRLRHDARALCSEPPLVLTIGRRLLLSLRRLLRFRRCAVPALRERQPRSEDQV